MRVFRRDQIVKLREQGISWRGIAERLGVPLSTVTDACRRISGSAASRVLGKGITGNCPESLQDRLTSRFRNAVREAVSFRTVRWVSPPTILTSVEAVGQNEYAPRMFQARAPHIRTWSHET
ncbi:MAG: helix-turn-helix domain-containing protein [Acidobacteria bacterium]|nr:helix-turn-helix domain-containing protein [Acidobacteriota bacterium]